MSEQPKALALADTLEKMPLGAVDAEAAAELRRLHECERDAMRYRWLRSVGGRVWTVLQTQALAKDDIYDAALDAAIDAAKDQA